MATFYYRLRCTTEGLDKDGFNFPALTSTDINSPPAAVCPTNGGHTVAAGSLTLIGTSGGQQVADQTIIGSMDVSGGSLLVPQGTGSAPVTQGQAFWKTDTQVLSIGNGSAAVAMAKASRAINTTAPITGGGDLSADRTLAVSVATASTVGVVQPDGTVITVSGGGAITVPNATTGAKGVVQVGTGLEVSTGTIALGTGANAHVLASTSGLGTSHSVSGLTSGQVLAATGATTAAFVSRSFSKSGTVLTPSAQNVILWRAPFACTVTALKGYRVGGTGATVNAGKGTTATPTNKVLASDLSLTSTEAWTDGGAVQNTAFAIGDPLIIIIQTVAGAPTQVGIQIDFTRP